MTSWVGGNGVGSASIETRGKGVWPGVDLLAGDRLGANPRVSCKPASRIVSVVLFDYNKTPVVAPIVTGVRGPVVSWVQVAGELG